MTRSGSARSDGSRARRPLLRRLLPGTVLGCLAAGVLLGLVACGTALCAVIRAGAHVQPAHRADVIIVLGAGCEPSGRRPLTVYRSRLEHARDLYQRGMADHIIVTERSPAAEAARDYLRQLGVPEEAVELEDRSLTTWENLRFARDIMRAKGWQRCIVVSDGFHLSRSLRMCRDLGVEAEGAATPYSPIEGRLDRRVKFTAREVCVYAAYLVRAH